MGAPFGAVPPPQGVSWRRSALARLSSETFDLVVVGGGATGAAIARDAALRGVSVALCDGGDFAGQTSSHSSKLIHGGLRYLQYGDLGLVFEGLAERHRLMTTAPHLCRPLEFLFPAYRGSRPSLRTLAIGVALYDALALWRPPVHSRRVRADELLTMVPQLRAERLEGAELYVDCQTDDARLVLENVLDAEAAGAAVASYVQLHAPAEARRSHLRVLSAIDVQSGDGFPVRARLVVNATGPFSDAFGRRGRTIRPTLGVHMVVDSARLDPGGRAVVINSPRDGRLMFTLPWGRRTIVGTTDTDWPTPDGEPPRPTDEIRARGSDVDYLLEAANHAFPAAALGRDEVVSTYAGLRPLVASDQAKTSATSREHDVWVDESGVLTVAGGKLTTMRRMGEEVVDRAIELLRARGVDRPFRGCETRRRLLPGGDHAASTDGHELAPDVERRLTYAYGARVSQVLALTSVSEALARRIDPHLPYIWAEVVFAARHDHACELTDVLRRRVPLFRDAHDQGLGIVEHAADLLARELSWSASRRARSLAEYREQVAISRRWRED